MSSAIAELRREIWRLDPSKLFKAIGLTPDPWQIDLLRCSDRQILMNCCRQSGKTTTASLLALHTAYYNPGSTVLIFAPAGRQSDEFLYRLGQYYRRSGQAVCRANDKVSALELANGSRIIPLPNNEEAIRGFTPNLVIIDEAARVPDPLYKAIRPMLAASHGRLVAISTPFGKQGWFYKAWIGEGKWKRVQIDADQCPRIDREFLEQERLEQGEGWFRQEYYCDFTMMEGAVYPEFEQCIIDPCEIVAKNAWGGIDFGWHNPAAIVILIEDHDGNLYVVEEAYGSRITDEELALIAKALQDKYHVEMFAGDPAAPQSIEKLRRGDVPVALAIKDVKAGIRAVGARIRTGRLKVFRACKNLIREMGLYKYDMDREPPVDQPVKEHDHTCDALRYIIARIDRIREPHGMKKREDDTEQDAPEPTEKKATGQQRYSQLDPSQPPARPAPEPTRQSWRDELDNARWE